MRTGDFLVDEIVVEVDGAGIQLCVGIEYAPHASPVQRAEAHRARLARGVYVAAVELEVGCGVACVPYCIHFGMGCGVVVDCHSVCAGGYDRPVFYNDCAKWASTFINIVGGKVACHFHKFAVVVGDCNFHCVLVFLVRFIKVVKIIGFYKFVAGRRMFK